MVTRRTVVAAAATIVVAASSRGDEAPSDGEAAKYGLVGRMTAVPGRRDDLARILLDGVAGMPGCLSYVVAADASTPDVLWITEAWASRDAHRASLGLPSVRQAIARGRPLIVAMEAIAETVPVGGHGLAAR